MGDKTRALLGDYRTMKLTYLSLFSGIRGLDLAAEWVGFTTVGQCEWANYPTRVLERHWPDVSCWQDIRTLTEESFYEGARLRTIDIILGGLPCRSFSVAGKRRGKEDDRYLWPEILRVISDLRSVWVAGEDVTGIVNMTLDQVYADLESEDCPIRAFIISACAINAPHRHDRCVIIRYRAPGKKHNGRGWRPNSLENSDCVRSGKQGILSQQPRRTKFERGGKDGANANYDGLEGQEIQGLPKKQEASVANGGWWPAEPDVDRISYGVPSRVDRLKYLGNAIVPQQFYPIFRAIVDVERGVIHE